MSEPTWNPEPDVDNMKVVTSERESVKYSKYYARSEGFYNFVYSIIALFFFCTVELIYEESLLELPFLTGIVSRIPLFLRALGIVFFLFFINKSTAACKPKFYICSHFLTMGYYDSITIPWDEIQSVHITGNTLKTNYKSNSSKKERKESIKHVEYKEHMIQEIKEYCEKYKIDFL